MSLKGIWKKHRKLLKKWHCGCDKQLLTFLCANQLMSGVVSLVSPVWQMHYIYLHRKMSREPSCSSGLWQDPVFFIIKQQFNLNIDEKTPNNFWLKLSLWCFSSQFKKKKSLFILQKRERRTEKLFPAWCLCTVNTWNIRCDSCSVREIRTKKGSWGDWCFDLSCINTLEKKTHISSTQTIKVVSLGTAGSYCFQQSCLINPGTRICFFKKVLDELMELRRGEEKKDWWWVNSHHRLVKLGQVV